MQMKKTREFKLIQLNNYNKKISVVPSDFQKSLTDIKVNF